MTLVVDCSVALKWVLLEDDRAAALKLIGGALAAPDFLKLECANVLAVKARRGLISKARARDSLHVISAMPGVIWRSTATFVDHAQVLAMETEQTSYDCLYLAMAIQEAAVVISDDRRFCDAIAQHGAYSGFVRRLKTM